MICLSMPVSTQGAFNSHIEVGSDQSAELSVKRMLNSRAFLSILIALFVLVLLLLTLHSTDLQQGWNYRPLILRNVHCLPPIATTNPDSGKVQFNSSKLVSKPGVPVASADIRTKVELHKPEQAFVALLLASNNKSSALPAHQLEDVMIEREQYAAKVGFDCFFEIHTDRVSITTPSPLSTSIMSKRNSMAARRLQRCGSHCRQSCRRWICIPKRSGSGGWTRMRKSSLTLNV